MHSMQPNTAAVLKAITSSDDGLTIAEIADALGLEVNLARSVTVNLLSHKHIESLTTSPKERKVYTPTQLGLRTAGMQPGPGAIFPTARQPYSIESYKPKRIETRAGSEDALELKSRTGDTYTERRIPMTISSKVQVSKYP